MEDPNVLASDNANPEDFQFLEEQINEFNFATTGLRDARLLVMLLRDSAGRVYAGLSGHTWGGVGEVRFLWVDQPRRHTGIGSRLLRAAEEEAISRGCTKIVLSTHSFQAPDFYLKRGYVVAGEFSDYPRGHSSIFLEKILPAAGVTAATARSALAAGRRPGCHHIALVPLQHERQGPAAPRTPCARGSAPQELA